MTSTFYTRTPAFAEFKSGFGGDGVWGLTCFYKYKAGHIGRDEPQAFGSRDECIARANAWGAPFKAHIKDLDTGETFVAADTVS